MVSCSHELWSVTWNSRSKSPKDFPHRYFPAVLPGTPPKLCARKLPDGTYDTGETGAERYERWQTCEAPVCHLRAIVATRGSGNGPTSSAMLERVRAVVPYKMWLTPDELDWVERRLVTSGDSRVHT